MARNVVTIGDHHVGTLAVVEVQANTASGRCTDEIVGRS
jgi:hypothetical protein